MERPPAEQIRAYYDEWAEREWDRFDRRPADRVNLEIHRRFLARLHPGDGVLEVGAGVPRQPWRAVAAPLKASAKRPRTVR